MTPSWCSTHAQQLQVQSRRTTMRNHGWELPYHPLQVSLLLQTPNSETVINMTNEYRDSFYNVNIEPQILP